MNIIPGTCQALGFLLLFSTFSALTSVSHYSLWICLLSSVGIFQSGSFVKTLLKKLAKILNFTSPLFVFFPDFQDYWELYKVHRYLRQICFQSLYIAMVFWGLAFPQMLYYYLFFFLLLLISFPTLSKTLLYSFLTSKSFVLRYISLMSDMATLSSGT